MNENVKKVLDSTKAFLAKFSKKTKIIAVSAAAAIIIAAIILTALMNKPSLVVLYPSLDSSEAKEVVAELESRGVEYEEKDGTIKVPEKDEESLRMELANQGHPYSTYNYDFFLNNVDVMTTDAERKILEKYQLAQKLESVISTLDCIDRASVTINLADKSSYVLSSTSDEVSTAGVTVTLKQGQSLSDTQVSGIKTLIAKSVPNLEIENIAVIDNSTGVELGSSSSIEVDKSTFKLSLQAQYEKDLEAKIKTMMEKIFGGQDNVQVAVKSDIDVDKSIKEVITYQPSEDNRGVVQHEERENNAVTDGTAASGIPGTDTNTGTTTYSQITADGDTIYVENKESYDYLVSQIKEQIQKDSAEIVNVSVSVAINKDVMSDTEKQDIAGLVANSAGVAQENVFVYNRAFNNIGGGEEPAVNPAPYNLFTDSMFLLISGIALAALLLLIIIILLFVRRSKKRKKLKAELEAEQAAPPAVDIMEDPTLEEFKIGKINPKETKAQAIKNQIQDFTAENPEIAAQLVRNWIKGGDEGNDQ